MTVQYVTLVIDEADAAEALVTRGSCSIAPSLRIPVPGGPIVGQAPVTRQFSENGPPQARLVACDTAGPQGDSGPGWAYTITYSGVPGAPQQWSFQLLSVNGPVQKLSALAEAPVAQQWAQLMPWPAGTPSPGAVPVYQPDGSVAWSAAVILDTTGGN